jgi:phytoene dehydrogenase-like protein
MSGGLIWGPATFELARRWIPRGSPELQRLLVDELEDAWSWLEGHGTPLEPPGAYLKDRMGRGRLMAVGAPGARGPWAETLLAATERQGVELLVESRVDKVEPGTDGWTVTWTRAGSRSSASARAVILCGGGFQNSTELVRRYISPWPEEMIAGPQCPVGAPGGQPRRPEALVEKGDYPPSPTARARRRPGRSRR